MSHLPSHYGLHPLSFASLSLYIIRMISFLSVLFVLLSLNVLAVPKSCLPVATVCLDSQPTFRISLARETAATHHEYIYSHDVEQRYRSELTKFFASSSFRMKQPCAKYELFPSLFFSMQLTWTIKGQLSVSDSSFKPFY